VSEGDVGGTALAPFDPDTPAIGYSDALPKEGDSGRIMKVLT
jgi:hypothetical protein